MFFIIKCPSCKNKIRFPLDKGTIKVNCPCGYSFIADPDDPSLYKRGSFDLKGNRKEKKKKLQSQNFNISQLPETIIKKLLSIKYTLQNFKLLPSAEQKKIIIYIILFLLVIAIVIFILNLILTPRGIIV